MQAGPSYCHTPPASNNKQSSLDSCPLDVLPQIPLLLELLTIEDRRILAETSKGLWAFARASLADIRVNKARQHSIIFRDGTVFDNASWPALARLSIHNLFLGPDETKVLAQAEWPRLSTLSLHRTKLSDAAAQHLAAGRWPLRSLDLSRNRLTSEAVSAIVKASWPCLKSLNLTYNDFDQTAAGFTDGGLLAASILITGQWPQLQALYLSDTRLKPQAVEILTKGPWPALSSIGLSYCPGLDVDTVCEAWPLLTSLQIECCSAFELHSARCISRLHPKMQQLMLYDNELGMEGLQLLLQADLQYLVKLSLGLNHFDGSALQLLVRGKWPRLEYLDVSHNKLSDQYVDWSQAIWPALRHLKMVYVFEAMDVLFGIAEAKWPLLRTLDVRWSCRLPSGSGYELFAVFGLEVVCLCGVEGFFINKVRSVS